MKNQTTRKYGVKPLTAAIILGLTLTSASAMASDKTASTPGFQVTSAATSHIRSGAKAFKKGEYAKSAMYSRVAIQSSLSNRREAIAQSNLCAAYGAMGEMENARLACISALELRPGYEPAIANKAALTYKLAKAGN